MIQVNTSEFLAATDGCANGYGGVGRNGSLLTIRGASFQAAITAITALLVAACISTPYRTTAVSELSDEQLIEELEACAAGVGASLNRAQYLMATKPSPAYVMSSSTTNYFGNHSARVSLYSAPTRYGRRVYGTSHGSYSGMAQTQYYYTDVHAFARTMHDLGTAIASAQAASFRKRGIEALTEIRARIEQRSAEARRILDQFFVDNPNLEPRKKLIAAILPWVERERPQLSFREMLEGAKQRMSALDRGEGMTGRWYGVFSQTSTLQNGDTVSFNRFLYLQLTETGEQVTGKGEIETGEQIEISGTSTQGRFVGVAANTTSAINARLTGIVADEQVVLEFVGAGLRERVKGVAVFFR